MRSGDSTKPGGHKGEPKENAISAPAPAGAKEFAKEQTHRREIIPTLKNDNRPHRKTPRGEGNSRNLT
jgi:hypothetical protein